MGNICSADGTAAPRDPAAPRKKSIVQKIAGKVKKLKPKSKKKKDERRDDDSKKCSNSHDETAGDVSKPETDATKSETDSSKSADAPKRKRSVLEKIGDTLKGRPPWNPSTLVPAPPKKTRELDAYPVYAPSAQEGGDKNRNKGNHKDKPHKETEKPTELESRSPDIDDDSKKGAKGADSKFCC